MELRDLTRAFRVFRYRPDALRELDEEIAFHMERTIEGLIEKGMDPDDAAREAERRFGDRRRHRRDIRRLDEGRWRMSAIRGWVDGIRYLGASARRSVVRSPGFAAAIVATLGLGMGANAVMFGVVDRLLLSPPQHIADADQVRRIYSSRMAGSGGEPFTSSYLAFGDYEDLLQVEGIAAAAAFNHAETLTIGRGEGARTVRVIQATHSLFPMLGVVPELGRFYREEEDAEGARRVAVVSAEYWQRAYGSDPNVIGQQIDAQFGRYEIIGVAPAGFTGVDLSPVDIWLPLRTAAVDTGSGSCLAVRNCWFIQAAVRLAPGTSVTVAEDQASAMHVAARADRVAAGQFDPDARIVTGSIILGRGPQPTAEASVSKWLAGVSLIVLLIACANVANLLLARSVRLRHELAVRVSLGASRARLLGELLAESLLLASLGSATALGIAWFGSDLLHAALLPNIAFTDTGLTSRLLIFLAIATGLTAILAGIIPAWQASRTALRNGMRSGRGSTGVRSRTQVGLLLAQAVFSVLLLIGAGLFVKSLNHVSELDLGYDYNRVVTVGLEFDSGLEGDVRAGIYADALSRARAIPGVAEAALTYTMPFWSSISLGRPTIAGIEEYERPASGGPYVNKVGGRYFQAMGLEITEGRGIEDSDDPEGASPVMVVSRSMAEGVWGDRSPVGSCVFLGDESPCTTVVGVVENHRREALVEAEPHHLYYINLNHPDFRGPPQAMMVRIQGDATTMAVTLRDALNSIAPQIRFANARPLANFIEPNMRSWRLGAAMFTTFGLLALLVAAVGMYSVLAFEIAQRRREMGVRSALGASQSNIVGMVFRSAMGLTTAGLAVGLVCAWYGSRFVEPLLFSVSGTDPAVYVSVAAVLILVAAIAATVPGWRAARVDPADALRAE